MSRLRDLLPPDVYAWFAAVYWSHRPPAERDDATDWDALGAFPMPTGMWLHAGGVRYRANPPGRRWAGWDEEA